MNKHSQYMQEAYELALKGWGKVLPNPMVGALLVKGNRIIAKGWHERCGEAHAEAMAIAKAGLKAKGCDLYVTLEPCSHFGRTPPCTNAIIKAGIKKVYVGTLDPNPRMNGKSVALLRKKGIAVEVGFLAEELNRLNEAFNKYITKKTPFVTAKIAQSIDGKVATLKGESQWITSQESRDYARALRHSFDAIMVGVNTVIKDDPRLTAADDTKTLKKIIIDTHSKTPRHAKLFKGTTPKDVLIFSKVSSSKLPATVIKAPVKEGLIDIKWVLKYLANQGIASVLIEGGGALIGNALRNKCVDKLHVYVAPQIIGEGLEAVRGLKIASLKQALTLKNMTAFPIGGDLFMEGYL